MSSCELIVCAPMIKFTTTADISISLDHPPISLCRHPSILHPIQHHCYRHVSIFIPSYHSHTMHNKAILWMFDNTMEKEKKNYMRNTTSSSELFLHIPLHISSNDFPSGYESWALCVRAALNMHRVRLKCEELLMNMEKFLTRPHSHTIRPFHPRPNSQSVTFCRYTHMLQRRAFLELSLVPSIKQSRCAAAGSNHSLTPVDWWRENKQSC